MTVPVLRTYQNDLVHEIRKAYRDGYKCPLVVLSTGGGKTMIFSYITHGASQRGNATLLVAHRRELIEQISLSLARFGVEHQLIAPTSAQRDIKIAHFKAFGRSFVNHGSATMVGSVQTIVRHFDTIDRTLERHKARSFLIIMDEAHHVVADTQWGTVMERYPSALGLKVTATPERLDGRGLGKGQGGFADVMIEGPPMSWMIDSGFLSPYRAFTTATPIDTTGVKLRMGDFARDELAEKVDKPAVIGDAVEHYARVARGLRAVVYCVSIAHSQHTAEQFNRAGISAAHLDGDTEPAERARIIRAYADGVYDVLCNQALFTEGFDLAAIAQKDVTIDCVIDLAPTQSLSLYMQKVGRALRPRPGKVAVLLDHAGNMLRHGLPDTAREWSLAGRKKTKRNPNDNDNEPDVAVRTCPQCFSITKPLPVCPSCGFKHEVRPRVVEEKLGELVELTDEQKAAIRRQTMRTQGKAQTVEEMVTALGYSRGRAEKIVAARREKERLREQCRNALACWYDRWKEPVKNIFGVFVADVETMKPQELRRLHEQIMLDNHRRRVAAVAD